MRRVPASTPVSTPDLAAALGASYVIEGSQLGGLHVAAAVAGDLGLRDDALTYLRPAGAPVGIRWNAFVAQLDAFGATATPQDWRTVEAAAIDTFAAFATAFRREGPDLTGSMPEPVDLTNCDREPIHVPGAVQPHGVLFACRGPAFTIVQVSDNSEAVIGTPPAGLLGRSMEDVLRADSWQRLVRAGEAGLPREVNPLCLDLADGRSFDGIVHLSATSGVSVVELEPRREDLSGFHPRMRQSVRRLQDAAGLAELFDIAAREIRSLTGFDRVMVYRFDRDWNGEVVAEARLDRRAGSEPDRTRLPSWARSSRRSTTTTPCSSGCRSPTCRCSPSSRPTTERGWTILSYDDYWRSIAPKERHAQITVPALNIGGWYDLFLGGTIANYTGMKQHGATEAARRPRLMIGPWAHGDTFGWFTGRSYGFASNYLAIDPTALHLRWFDRHLKGIDNGLDDEPPVRLFIMGIDEWRDEQDWPLPDTGFTPYYLHSDGHANTAAGDGTLSTAGSRRRAA